MKVLITGTSTIENVDILINNAGTQNEDDIDINLKALIWITEAFRCSAKYQIDFKCGFCQCSHRF